MLTIFQMMHSKYLGQIQTFSPNQEKLYIYILYYINIKNYIMASIMAILLFLYGQ